MAPESDVYRLLFIPEEPIIPEGLWASAEGRGLAIRLLPGTEAPKQQWMVRHTGDNRYTIQAFSAMGEGFGFGLDGPVRPDASVKLLPGNMEWIVEDTNKSDEYIISAVPQGTVGDRWVVAASPGLEVVLKRYPIEIPSEQLPRWQFVTTNAN